jgi:hypothetical protein
MNRFPPPSVTTLKISHGDTLIVKSRLNAGESRAAYARMIVEGPHGEPRIDRVRQGIAVVLAYLVDWSLVDGDGHVVVIRQQPEAVVMAALDALDTDSYLEIKDAIEMHDASVLAARLAEKNEPGGATESSAISPLPVAVTGDTNGSPS